MNACPCGAPAVITYRAGHGMARAATATPWAASCPIEWQELSDPMHLCEACYVAQVRNQAANMGKRPPALARIKASARKPAPRSQKWRAVKARAKRAAITDPAPAAPLSVHNPYTRGAA